MRKQGPHESLLDHCGVPISCNEIPISVFSVRWFCAASPTFSIGVRSGGAWEAIRLAWVLKTIR